MDAITAVTHAKRRECEECIKIGGTLGTPCGPARSAARPCAATIRRTGTRPSTTRATQHPVIASAEPGERWLYCYPDDAFVEY